MVKLPGRSTRFAMWLAEPGFARPIDTLVVESDLVLHEIAHHLGIDDERLHELGWD